MHFITFVEEKLSEVASVLTGDPGDERRAALHESRPGRCRDWTASRIKALGLKANAHGAAAVADAAQLLLDQAFIIEGEQVPDPAGFARRLADVMAKALG